MNELNQPTIISIKQYDTTTSISIERSDTDVREMVLLFFKVLKGQGYYEESIENTICEIAEEIKNKETTFFNI